MRSFKRELRSGLLAMLLINERQFSVNILCAIDKNIQLELKNTLLVLPVEKAYVKGYP